MSICQKSLHFLLAFWRDRGGSCNFSNGDMFSYDFDTKYADLQPKTCMEGDIKGKFQKYFVRSFLEEWQFLVKMEILKTLV